MSREISRRGILGGALSLGGLAAFGGLSTFSRLAEASVRTDRYYIFCYFSGGWDVLLGLDPRDPDHFRSDNKKETLIEPGYDLMLDLTTAPEDRVPFSSGRGTLFGGYLGNMRSFADDIAVVRGMSMDTLTHEAGRRRFITGKVPSGLNARGSSIATHLAYEMGESDPIPNLAVSHEAYNVDAPPWASALSVASGSDLVRTLKPSSSAMSALEQAQIDAMLQGFANCDPTPLAQDAFASRGAARDLVSRGLYSLFDFGANTTEMQQLRAKYGIGTDYGSPEAQAAIAVTALTNHISRCVSITVNGESLDTHYDDWQRYQGLRQRRGFNNVAAIMADLAARPYGDGSSWLDHTTIIGYSEFSRTATLNANFGRDHSLTNSCFLTGGGIRGGVYGASSDYGMAPQPMNLVTGSVDNETGEIVRPEHVLRAVMVNAGIEADVADLRVEPLAALYGGA